MMAEDICNGNDPSQKYYYGVYLSPEMKNSKDNCLVFTDRVEAIKMVKKFKRSRFKRFISHEEAFRFSQNGSDQPGGLDVTPSALNCERAIPHKAPRPQELVKLRKCIEGGDISSLEMMINDNPRLLISSGDTPAILQEGSRYNALHCAAKACNGMMASYILETVSSVTFMKRLYGLSDSENLESLYDRCKFLVDLFLNTPDKSLNETPLHFASKFGAVDVVEVLLSYPQCKRKQINKFHQTPLDIACSRVCVEAINCKRKIVMLLEDCYYVPVLRSNDVSIQAFVGEPFTLELNPESTNDQVILPFDVKAVAGPMDQTAATMFRKRWKASCYLPKYQNKVLKDTQKGLECVGRELALDVQWTEYWSFLDLFVDLRTQQGLILLEEFLKKQFKQCLSKLPNGAGQSTKISADSSQESSLVSSTALSDRKMVKLKTSGNQKHSVGPIPKLSMPSEVKPMDPVVQMDCMCREFSRRLIKTILLNSENGIHNEVAHIQNYISSCADDIRFKTVNLKEVHSHLAQLCFNKLDTSEKKIAFGVIETVIKDIDSASTPKTTSVPLVCILSFLYAYLTKEFMSSKSDAMDEWLCEKKCSCEVVTNKKCSLARRVLFCKLDDDAQDSQGKYANLRHDESKSNSSDSESDTSDSESEFYYTPPTSPGMMMYDSSPSSDDDSMVTPDEVPGIFILGDEPTKMDAAVLEAIADVFIDPLKYPHILRWKHSCSHDTILSVDNWPSSPCRVTPPKCDLAMSQFSPPWHPSRLLLRQFKRN